MVYQSYTIPSMYMKKVHGINYCLIVSEFTEDRFNTREEAFNCMLERSEKSKGVMFVIVDNYDRIVASHGNTNSLRRDEPAVVADTNRPATSIPNETKVTIRTLSGTPYLFLEGRQVCALDEQQARLLLSAFIDNSNAGRQTN